MIWTVLLIGAALSAVLAFTRGQNPLIWFFTSVPGVPLLGVVGLVPGQIRTLHTLPKGELGTGSDGQRHFAQWLKQISERKNEDG